MNIAHLTSVHSRTDTRIFLKECRSLQAQGHAVTLMVADGKGPATIDEISIIDVGRSRSRLARMMWATRRIKQAAIDLDADLYHFHDPELIPVGLALKRRGKLVIFDAHEAVAKQLLTKPYLNAPVRRMLSWAYSWYESQHVHKFDAIVAATPYIRDQYRTNHNCVVDINNFPLADELESPGSWEKKEPAVCFIGGICRIRGIVELVHAMSHLRGSARLHLAGTFSDSEQLARAHPGFARIEFWGQIARASVRDVMSRSMAGIVSFHPVPNHIDAQPNKMFEYMSAGIPVIASDFPLWRDIIEGNRCGICVDPMDPKAIARAIDSLVANPAMAQEMGANGRRAVMERYNWGIEERKLLALYESLS